MIDALVIFQNENAHPFGGLLKRGYRHVWCAVIDDREHGWVGHDLRLAGHVTSVLADVDYPIADHFRQQGMEVIGIRRGQYRLTGPLILNNCVGMTKSICGIRSLAVTPWQLRQHLIKTSSGDIACHASPCT